MEFYVLKEIIVFLISFVIFQSITISFGEYLLVLDLIWGVLLYFFNRSCNYRFHRAVFAGVLGNWVAYLLSFMVNKNFDITIFISQLLNLNIPAISIIMKILVLALALETIFACKFIQEKAAVNNAKSIGAVQEGKDHEKHVEKRDLKENDIEKKNAEVRESIIEDKKVKMSNDNSAEEAEKEEPERESEESGNRGPVIFKEHEYDIERIKVLLKETRILGIHSSWGNGKSFVVDHFCDLPEIKKQYFIIKIEALAYQYDEFDKVLISKLDELLIRHHIFSFYASEVLNTLGKSIWGRLVYHYFRGNETGSTSVFEGLKEEVGHLPKKVLIVFEDLERVNQEDAVKKILAVSELLAGNSIRVIYEYDRKYFAGISQEYLEKYIPVEMNLTEISFTKLVSYLWDELGMEAVNKKIVNNVITNENLKSLINEMTIFRSGFILLGKTRQAINLDEEKLPIRCIKSFLIEMKNVFEKSSIDRNSKSLGYDELKAKTVVAFLYIKHFLYKYYERLKAGQDLDDCIPLVVNERQMNIKDVYREALNKDSDKDLIEDLEKEENKWVLTIYNMFSYCIDDYEVLKGKSFRNSDNGRQLNVDDWARVEAAREKRNRCNHLIWNLLQNGRSEYSDAEACVNKFIKDVLNCPEYKWEKDWERFCYDLYSGQIFKDNRTINLIGHDYLYDLVKAFSYQRRNKKTWIKFIHFVFFIWGNKPIDTELIDIMNTFSLESNDTIVEVLKAFNSLQSEGNFNLYKAYWNFFDHYVGKLMEFGYLDRQFSWGIDYESEFKDGHIKKLIQFLEKMVADAAKKSNDLSSNTWKEDIRAITTFIKKNEEIIQMKEVAKEKKPGVSIKCTESEAIFPNQKIIDRILKKISNKSYSTELEKQVNAEMEQAYDERQLYPAEICRIKEEIERWKNSGENHKDCKDVNCVTR